MTATNHQGWEVQAYCNWTGWKRASKVVQTAAEAQELLEAWPVAGLDLRVYESLGRHEP